MTIRPDDVAVLASFGGAALVFYSMGYRPKSTWSGLILICTPAIAWIACRIWGYSALERAGLPPLIGALPAIAAYVAVAWVTYRGVGGLTFRLPFHGASFGRVLLAADETMGRTFAEKAPMEANGKIDGRRMRIHLEEALASFRTIDPPSAAWRRLVDERAEQYEAFIDVLTSAVPVDSEAMKPLEEQSRDWNDRVRRLLAEDERSG